jgi:hypothetical protein
VRHHIKKIITIRRQSSERRQTGRVALLQIHEFGIGRVLALRELRKEVIDENSKQKFKDRTVGQPTAVQTLESL